MLRSLCLVGLVACTSPNYGAPTAQTEIKVSEDGGFAGPLAGWSVHILGNTVAYTSQDRNGTATVTSDNVAQIIHALEDMSFLDLHGDYEMCPNAPTDMPVADFTATLAAGTNTLAFYTGCKGGTFDELTSLETTIQDRSGWTAWHSN